MKKMLFVAILAIASAFSAYSQPKAVGGRIGALGLEASYQHDVAPSMFVEADLGLDYFSGYAGVKATAMLNYSFLQPSWTSRGEWDLYAGAGLSTGYVYDWSLTTFTYHHPYYGTKHRVHDRWGYGYMLGFPVQVGLSYTFWFPLKLAVDVRPTFGFHVSEHLHPDSNKMSHVGLYGNGIWGFLPTVSVYYVF